MRKQNTKSRPAKKQPFTYTPDEPIVKRLNLVPAKFDPKGKAQIGAYKAWKAGKNLFLHGFPGTGKTFIAVNFGIMELKDPESPVEKIVICRSAVPTRDIGFLKGTEEEKTAAYESPYIEAINTIYGNKGAYEQLKRDGKIEFINTSFQRGNNIENAVLILDEIQNYSFEEAHTLITRPKEGTRVIISGDASQDDLTSERYSTVSGLAYLSRILAVMDCFERFEFGIEDVRRSEFVKFYLIAKGIIDMEDKEKKEKEAKRQILREIPDEINVAVLGDVKPRLING